MFVSSVSVLLCLCYSSYSSYSPPPVELTACIEAMREVGEGGRESILDSVWVCGVFVHRTLYCSGGVCGSLVCCDVVTIDFILNNRCLWLMSMKQNMNRT